MTTATRSHESGSTSRTTSPSTAGVTGSGSGSGYDYKEGAGQDSYSRGNQSPSSPMDYRPARRGTADSGHTTESDSTTTSPVAAKKMPVVAVNGNGGTATNGNW